MDGKLRKASIVSLAKVAPLVLCKALIETSDISIRDSMVSGIGAAREFLFVIVSKVTLSAVDDLDSLQAPQKTQSPTIHGLEVSLAYRSYARSIMNDDSMKRIQRQTLCKDAMRCDN